MFCFYKDRILLSKVLIRLYVLNMRGYMMMDFDFDFDYMKNLYIDNPVEFERICKLMINDAISNMKEDSRDIQRAKQWRLEQELNKIHDPIERMNRMVSIFWAGVNEFVVVTKNFKSERDSQTITPRCGVIVFKSKTEDHTT